MNPAETLARIRVVLCNTTHPGNIGAAARAMKTMGLHRLYLVSPRHFPDPEADARASGAVDVLAAATVCASLDEALAGTVLAVALSARRRDVSPPSRQAREATAELVRFADSGEVALVFGGETAGLTNEEVGRCSRLVEIPADPAYSSLNLGSAVQVLCYETRMAAYAERPPATDPGTSFSSPPAGHDEVEGFYGHLERVMIASGFHDPAQPKRLLPKLRRLFGRAGLEKDEVNILRGILAAVEKPFPGGK